MTGSGGRLEEDLELGVLSSLSLLRLPHQLALMVDKVDLYSLNGGHVSGGDGGQWLRHPAVCCELVLIVPEVGVCEHSPSINILVL